MKTWVLVTVLLLAGSSSLAENNPVRLIKGRVVKATADIPLAGVIIEINNKKGAAQTDPSGRFQIDLAKILPATGSGDEALTLIFTKENFKDVNRVFPLNSTERSELENITVHMDPDYSLFSHDDSEKLKKSVSKEGYTLFVIPYDIQPGLDPRAVESVTGPIFPQSLYLLTLRLIYKPWSWKILSGYQCRTYGIENQLD